MPEYAFMGPFRERNFRNQAGLDPMHAFRLIANWRIGEWTVICFEKFELSVNFCKALFVKTRADAAGIDEFMALSLHPNEEGSEPRSRATGIGESSDDKFLFVYAFDLAPLMRSRGNVAA